MLCDLVAQYFIFCCCVVDKIGDFSGFDFHINIIKTYNITPPVLDLIEKSDTYIR